MKISTKGRYGLQMMIEIAYLGENNQSVSVSTLAGHLDVGEKYVEQIISSLLKAGYIKSKRGPKGGYSLAVHPNHITVGMILRCLETSMSPSECVSDDPPDCMKRPNCVVVSVWQKMKNAVDNVVDSITIYDLVQQQREIDLRRGRCSAIGMGPEHGDC